MQVQQHASLGGRCLHGKVLADDAEPLKGVARAMVYVVEQQRAQQEDTRRPTMTSLLRSGCMHWHRLFEYLATLTLTVSWPSSRSTESLDALYMLWICGVSSGMRAGKAGQGDLRPFARHVDGILGDGQQVLGQRVRRQRNDVHLHCMSSMVIKLT